jgi:hypothetical protein
MPEVHLQRRHVSGADVSDTAAFTAFTREKERKKAPYAQKLPQRTL